MSAATKTGIYWVVAAVMVAVAAIVAWPTPTRTELGSIVGKPLFEDFQDPLAAASLRIVRFDPEQSEIEPFEVRKDRETGVWTIPSRQGYPADAVEQMKQAANALVDLRILDIQTENPEDHDDLGVLEPKREDVQVGDEGVGRLVTFKDASQDTLASLIIGNPVEDEEDKIYVRKPGQDPVYVVSLDDSTLTTNFQDWIEEDLLQLSSIDVQEMVIKDYNASTNIGGQIALTRNYNAELSKDGSQWQLDRLLEYDPNQPLADPTEVPAPEDQELNAAKLNGITNALDDLAIVDVVRKPEGMSASLRADEELISDNEALSSLASRGFYPISRENEILSANGELTTTTNEGVQYVMRFGEVSGLSEDSGAGQAADGAADTSASGLNRYLLVTARVNEDHFPPPDLQEVPQDLDDLRDLLGQQQDAPASADAAQPAEPAQGSADGESAGENEPVVEEVTPSASAEDESTEPAGDEEPADDEEPAGDGEDAASENASSTDGENESAEPEASQQQPSDSGASESEEPAEDDSAFGQPVDAVRLVAAQDDTDPGQPADGGDADAAQPAESSDAEATDDSQAKADSPETDSQSDSEPAGDAESDASQGALGELEGLTKAEKRERLEAEQEKITKANQRKIDRRNDEIETARRRVRELNARFADWYYVIPEQTYRQLRVERDELFVSPGEQQSETSPGNLPGAGDQPSFQIPGFPGGGAQ